MKKLIILSLALCLLLCGCGRDAQPQEKIIALLDTGISTEAISEENILPGHNYAAENADTQDRINHGTAVASLILGSEKAGVEGIAPEAKIVPLVIADKVDGKTVSVSPDVLAEAIIAAVDEYGARIINVSLGIKSDRDELREAVEYARKKGALVVSAVGNGGDSGEKYYPAAYEGVLAVGSHDRFGKVSDFTQLGGIADILAPGEDIYMASRSGESYVAKGTSYATGCVSAAAAVYWQRHPSLSADEVAAAILESARETDGWLILDAARLLEE